MEITCTLCLLGKYRRGAFTYFLANSLALGVIPPEIPPGYSLPPPRVGWYNWLHTCTVNPVTRTIVWGFLVVVVVVFCFGGTTLGLFHQSHL